ncbi:CbiQ family ECF transporter T component [Acinetobacter bereziniae]|uniref:CbiQ family ECF transporter T component n=1 Tax=Acinetobacter bereziniae TaxID=106648 RepID=UPI0021CEA3D7|nr:CbiQ family ECF transporter T component [Acinetobacter bereziniae]MCU4417477.1 CbiQ family ECF transporter T component [Acinetobacter bereziniae]
MWNFLKQFFSKSQVGSDAKNKKNHEIMCEEGLITSTTQVNQNIPDSEYYTYHTNNKKLTELESSLLKLNSYDGYLRQKMLKKFKDYFDSDLFPHLLYRLSDYVDVNRQLAAQHILRWSQRPEFSKLCVDYFYEISMLRNRDRTDLDSFNLLLSKIAENKAYLSETLINQQGKLPRILLNFIIDYQWIDESELFELCEFSKDQHIRAYWLEHLIQHKSDDEILYKLKRSSYKDVKYRLFDFLYQKDLLTIDDLIIFWHSHFFSIMDYAYFTLRQKKFDFEDYFKTHPTEALSSYDAKIRAYQWILLKGDHDEFLSIIKQIHHPLIVNSILFSALRQKYIQISEYLSIYKNMQLRLSFSHLSKAKKYLDVQPTLDELIQYLSLITEEIGIQARLELVSGYNTWERLYWYVNQHDYITTNEDQSVFDIFVRHNLRHLKYAYGAMFFTESQKLEMQKRLPHFITLYPDVFEEQNVQKSIKPYLE